MIYLWDLILIYKHKRPQLYIYYINTGWRIAHPPY